MALFRASVRVFRRFDIFPVSISLMVAIPAYNRNCSDTQRMSRLQYGIDILYLPWFIFFRLNQVCMICGDGALWLDL